MEDYEQKLEDSTTSKINSGMLINLRLNELWKDAHRHARDGKYAQWNDDLDRVWCELGGDEDENSDADRMYNFLTLNYAKSCENIEKPTGFNKPNTSHKTNLAQQKQSLIKKELFLRRLQNKQGKGTAYHDSSEDYMD